MIKRLLTQENTEVSRHYGAYFRNVNVYGRFVDALESLTKFFRFSKRTALLILVVVVMTIIISAVVSILLQRLANLHVPSLGTIKTMGVEAYWDPDLKNKTEMIDWGTIWPAMSKNITLHLRSISNIETTLELRTANWTFRSSNNIVVAGASDTTPYMNLTWNYNETIVRPGETIQVTLALSVDYSYDFIGFLIANDVKEFGVNIIICASQYGD